MADDTDPHEASDAMQAFEDLRAEVAELRRAVEALPGAWQENQPPDYSPDLGRIVQGLAGVAGQLDGIQQHPALQLTPEQHRQAVAAAGNLLMREAVHKLDRASQEAERARDRLAGLIGTARRQDQQRKGLLWTGLAAFVVGLLVSPFIAGLLPFGLNGQVAALIMKEDRWHAGMSLMEAGSPGGWRGVVDSSNLVRVNREALVACREAAAKEKKEQRCAIVVPAR